MCTIQGSIETPLSPIDNTFPYTVSTQSSCLLDLKRSTPVCWDTISLDVRRLGVRYMTRGGCNLMSKIITAWTWDSGQRYRGTSTLVRGAFGYTYTQALYNREGLTYILYVLAFLHTCLDIFINQLSSNIPTKWEVCRMLRRRISCNLN